MGRLSIRKFHRQLSIWVAVPILIMVSTGIILQLRSSFEWVQPTVVKTNILPNQSPLSLEQIIEKLGERKKEIEQIIYRPEKNNVSVRLKGDLEVQLNPQTGEILKEAKRRANFLIELHQGSFFSKYGQFGIFFPSGIALMLLIITGIVIYFQGKKSKSSIV